MIDAGDAVGKGEDEVRRMLDYAMRKTFDDIGKLFEPIGGSR